MKDKTVCEREDRKCYLCDVKRAPDFSVISDEMVEGKVRKCTFVSIDHSSSWAGLTKQQGPGKRENSEWHSAVYLSMNHSPSIANPFFFFCNVVEFS